MKMISCELCKKEMPIEVLKPMVDLSNSKATLRVVCPFCQQLYGDNSPDHRYVTISKPFKDFCRSSD
ncbi:MAG: hypothetical protein ACM3QW_07225 [Ignavibacteriales bacterium]